MQQFSLNAELRSRCGKGEAHRLRQAGKIPAVYYGKNQENLHLSVNPADLEKAVSSELGMNTLIQLKVPGKGDYSVLIRDYQADAIKRHFIHADFVHVDLTKKIQVSVPIHLVGRPAGLKEGGILEQITRELQILCLPIQIPKQIEVDVSALKIGQNLHLEDIQLPAGVEPQEKINVTIAAVIIQKEEEVLTPGTMVEPEVLTAKKEAAPEGEAAAVKKEGATKEGAAPAKTESKPAEKEKK